MRALVRICTGVLLAAGVGRPLAAQCLPTVVPSTLPSSRNGAPGPVQDSVRQSDDTLWLLGALLGAGILGLVGAGLSGLDDTEGGNDFVDGLKGFLIGAAVGFPVGGLIGDAIHITPAPDSALPAPPSNGLTALWVRRGGDLGQLLPRTVRVTDSIRPQRETFGREVALIGTAAVGLVGAAGGGGCRTGADDHPAGTSPAAAGLGFVVAGIGIGFAVGGLIGGASPKDAPRILNREDGRDADRTDQPARQARAVRRPLAPTHRR